MKSPNFRFRSWRLAVLPAVVALAPVSSVGAAVIYNFSGNSGLWSETSTWTPSGVPGSADSLSLSGSINGEVGLDTARTISSLTSATSGTVLFSDQTAGTASLTVSGNLLMQNNPGVLHFGTGTTLNVTGTTTIRGGNLLRIDGTANLTGNLLLGSGSSGYGILGLGSGDFNGTVGTGAGQVNFSTTGGGFAAFNADRTVTFNGGAALTSLNLVLGHSTSSHMVTVTNNFTALNGINVLKGSAAVDARLSGNLSGTTAFVKTGNGTLELTGTNTYAQGGTGTRVNGGILLISGVNALSTASRLILAGSVLGLGAGNFDWGLGGGASELVMLGDSVGTGFAAYGADRRVNIGGNAGAGTALTWASTTGFFSNANGGSADHLILNVAESGYKLTFENSVDLNAATRKITVGDGSAGIDAALTGVISGNGSSVLRKQGAGTLELTNANTYAGGTNVAEGTLLANNASGSATGSGTVNLSTGAALGGTGTINGLVITAGTTSSITPGSNSTSTLNLIGGVDATSGATFLFTLGTTSDALNLGSSTFTGSSIANGLRFNFTNGGGLLAGVDYVLMTFGGHSGLELSDLIALSTPAGFNVDSFTINDTDLRIRFSAVPEPGSAGLLILGFSALLGIRRLRIFDVNG